MKRKCMVCLDVFTVVRDTPLICCCRACNEDYASTSMCPVEWAAKRARLFARRARQKLERNRKVAS